MGEGDGEKWERERGEGWERERVKRENGTILD